MYGDGGNVSLLKRRAEKRNISVSVHAVSKGEDFLPSAYDIVVLGSGQDFENTIVLADLSAKKEALESYIENDGVLLAIGSGFQMLGTSFVTRDGEMREGLSLFPVVTHAAQKSFVGDAVVKTDDFLLVGFENHFGVTDIGEMNPLGTALYGTGNGTDKKEEGMQYKNTFCTFLHGPLLAKSPEFADFLLLRALRKKYQVESLAAMDDTFSLAARDHILNKLHIQ